MEKELWVCEKNKTAGGKPVFKPLSKVIKEKRKSPNIVVIERGNLIEFNETLETLIADGFELLDTAHKHQDEFFSSYTATLINLQGGKHYGIRRRPVSSTNSAIH